VEEGSVRATRTFLSWIVTSALTIALGFGAVGLVRANAPTTPTTAVSASRATLAPEGASAPLVTTPAATSVPYVASSDDGADWSGAASRPSGVSSLAYVDGSGDH
jgi:hypothetical protein